MTPLALSALLAPATVAVAVACGGVVIALTGWLLLRPWWFTGIGARTRASLLAQARLAPLSLTLLALPLVQLAFWRFEPAAHQEVPGLVLPLLAVAGLGVLGTVMVRGWRALAATREVARAWRTTAIAGTVPGWRGRAWVVETAFPVVAVVGVRRPDLYVSADVLGACSAAELAAISAHEHAHVAARDNLMRVLFALAPAAGWAAARVEEAWASTVEEAADLGARAAGDGVTLARALTTVARLSLGTAAAPPLAMSAFIGGDSLEARVRRLLEPARPAGPACAGLTAGALATLVVAVVVWGLPAVYAAAEALVRLGR
ncbi:MAG: M48 family metalloprotease [Acidobacteria bacterium]|nr:M48 family metalloprotease [Acidobacteriota bacterium]